MMSWEEFREYALDRIANPVCIDGRDAYRIIDWMKFEDIKQYTKDGTTESDWTTRPYTRDVVVEQMLIDAEFGSKKATDERGISSSLMHDVVSMWMDVMQDDDAPKEYGMYGHPLFDYVLKKYGNK